MKFFSSAFRCNISSGNLFASTRSSFKGVDTASSSTSKKFPLMNDYFIPSNMCLVIAFSWTRRSKSLGSSITSGSSTAFPSSSISAGLNPFSNLRSYRLYWGKQSYNQHMAFKHSFSITLSFSLARWLRRFFFNSKTGILYWLYSFYICVCNPVPLAPMIMILGGGTCKLVCPSTYFHVFS